MSASSVHFRVGLFVLVASALGVGGILLFGAGQLLQSKVLAETYLDESAQGLEVGSPVKFRGVEIGSVEAISFVRSRYAATDEDAHVHGRYVLLDLALTDRFATDIDTDMLEHLVDEGLRIRLASAGLTGVAYLEIDFLDKERNPRLEIQWTPRSVYIPSAESTAAKLTSALDRIVDQIERARVDEIGAEIRGVLASLRSNLDDELKPILRDVRNSTGELPELARSARESVAALERLLADASEAFERDIEPAFAQVKAASERLEPILGSVDAAAAELPATIEGARRTLRHVDDLATSRRADVEEIFSNIRLVTSDLKRLTSTIQRYPAHALFGDPPPRRAPGDK